MKPSSKLGSLCALVFCCVATTFAAPHAATRMMAHPMFDVRGPIPHPIQRPVRGAIPNTVRGGIPGVVHRNVRAQPPLNMAGRHFQRRRFFQTGFIGPYVSGSYLTAPDYGYAAGPSAYGGAPSYYVQDEPAEPVCVAPLVIDLRTRHRPHKWPRVTYGQPSYCPPAVVVAAPLKHTRERRRLD
jgi:hypothetical protein